MVIYRSFVSLPEGSECSKPPLKRPKILVPGPQNFFCTLKALQRLSRDKNGFSVQPCGFHLGW